VSDKDKRKGWLRDLKVGDLVLVDHGWTNRSIGKIEKITPTGKMSVGSSRYRADGFEEGKGYYNSHLRILTTENRLEMANENLIDRIERNIDFIKNSPDLMTKRRRFGDLDNKKLGEFHRYLQEWREKHDN